MTTVGNGFSAEQLSHAQQEYIGNVIEVLHQTEADFLKKIQRQASKEPTNYRGRREPLEIAPNPSISFGNPDGGILATPGAPDLSHLLIPYVWLNTGLETTYNTILNQNKNTVGDAVQQLAESTGRTLVKWMNIFASNSNGTTRIGLVSARTSNSVLTLDDSHDSIGATQVLVNQRVKVYDPTGTTQRTGVVGTGAIKIASKTKTTLTRDATNGGIDWPSTVVGGDIIVPEGDTPAVGFHGIPAITNDVGDYFGLPRSVVDVLQSIIKPQGWVALTATAMYATHIQLKQRIGNLGLNGTGITEIACGMTQKQAYYQLIPAQVFQHVGGNRPSGDVGLADFEFTWFGLPINDYLDWRGSRMDYLNFNYLKIANMKEAGKMMGMPINDEMQSFDGASNNWRAAKAQFWDVARDYFSTSPHRFAAITELAMSGLEGQKGHIT